MEHVGEVMSEGEWSNFSHEIYSSSPDEDANFMEQLLGNSLLLSYQYWNVQESAKINETSMYSSSSDDYNHFHSQETSTHCFNNGSFLFPPPPYSSHQVSKAENDSISMDYYYVVDERENPQNDMLMETNGDEFILNNQDLSDDGCMESNEINHDADHHIMSGLHGADMHRGMAHDDMMIAMNDDRSHSSGDEKVSSPSSDITKKRPPVSPIDNFLKNKRSSKHKKSQMISSSSTDIHGGEHDEKPSNTMSKRQHSMMTCCSTDEDDSVGTSKSISEKGGAISNTNAKTRANRGSATDPQSLYARKRRERINERLKILQNLVPNGTKVDISTMLEEAVQYVNFLQLQIKLLSSDEQWMYAPIAYNGMDIGLDSK